MTSYVRDVNYGRDTLTEGHYEFDTLDNARAFWEPANLENELEHQLQNFTISPDGLRLVLRLVL